MPEVMETQKVSAPWKGVCCSRCYVAKSEKKKCKCRCHGEYHGVGRWVRKERNKDGKS